jgi:hypothetical protein
VGDNQHFTFCTGSTNPLPFNARHLHMRQYGEVEKKTLDPVITTYLWT